MDLTPILKKKYPEGSVGPGTGRLQGECVVFCQHLAQFPTTVGDFLWNKRSFVDKYGIRAENLQGDFKVGDIIFTTESLLYGHVAFVTHKVDGNPIVSESNFKSKKRVSHGRMIPKDSKKIIGVCRFPLKVGVGLSFPIRLKVAILMNNFPKQWNSKCFGELAEWFKVHSAGRIELDIYPVYTSLKNWWYSYYGSGDGLMYKVIDKGYFEENATNYFPNCDVTVLVVNKKEWEGEVWGKPHTEELGWYYPRTNPAQIIVACDEHDVSPHYYGKQLFQDAIEHEIAHYLYYMGQNQYFDYTHTYHPQRRLEQIFQDLDYTKIIINK